jgi:putative exosortase-associated protein (TIGR04073 family)
MYYSDFKFLSICHREIVNSKQRSSRMRKAMVLGLVLMGLLMTQTAYAEENVWEMANSPKYGTKVGGMLGRGLINVATCFMDLIVQTVEGTQDGPPFVGTMTGLGGGLGCSALRVTSGALDVLTFWVPDFNGIPVGRSYSNCLEGIEAAPAAYETPAVDAQVPAARQYDSNDYVKK